MYRHLSVAPLANFVGHSIGGLSCIDVFLSVVVFMATSITLVIYV